MSTHLHRLRSHGPQPEFILIWEIRPLVYLIIDIQSYDPTVRILAARHPAFDTRKDLRVFHAVVGEPCFPCLKVFPGAHTPRNRVPPFLCLCLLRDVAKLDDELCRFMLSYDGEELMVWCKVVELVQALEREDSAAEVASYEYVIA